MLCWSRSRDVRVELDIIPKAKPPLKRGLGGVAVGTYNKVPT